ncbi:PQQ-binding-like beta-propeller repeat protein [Actinoplanes sp. NPDC049599]|uniref:outer membrane protein assembly factor BamB family protein n=1 Tax=Actinoplanes sp. NPDC049599 TaxID=3363903 RepID=UPI0037AD0616
MTIIELGDPGSAAPVPAPARRRLHHRVVARRAVAVAVLCAATLAGSAVPGSTVIRPRWSIAFTSTSLVDADRDTVFVQSINAGSQVTAYELGSGEVRWSKGLPMPRGRMTARVPGAVLVPILLQGTAALDPRTGAEMWRLPGDVVSATPGTALLTQPDRTLSMVRMADGGRIWSRAIEGDESWAVVGPERQRIVAATPDGRLQMLRLSDGALLSQGHVDNNSGVPVRNGLVVESGLLFVNRLETDRAVVTAYDLDTLRQRWRYAQSATDKIVTGPAARACGVVLCFTDGSATVGLDPGTGTVRWRAAGFVDAVPVTGQNRALVDSADHGRYALIDTVTGTVMVSLGAGTAVRDAIRSVPAYYLRPIPPDGSRVTAGRIDLATGGLQWRGIVDAVGPQGCTAVAETLICGTEDGRLTVTDVG